MSLLLDALKRAEQEKLAKQQAEAPAAKEPAPMVAAPATASILELAPMGRAGAATGPAKSDAQAAQTLFAAKAAADASAGSRRPLVWSLVALAVLALVGGGGYLWYSLNALAPKTALRAPAPLPPVNRPIAPAPPSAGAPSAPAMPSGIPAASSIPVAPPGAPVAAAASTAGPSPAARAATESREDMLVRMVRESASAEGPPVRLSRSTEAPRVSPEVAAGYQALLNGQLAEARRAYTAAAASDPASADAALGLATVEARAGNATAATAHYRKALELDPRNATALAGLASMADYSRPDAVETQLRSDIARYPQSAALLVALGNLYALQSRWTEAQAAYFDAHRLEPAGADILYNLAVSLDHLGKTRVAADYYRRALESARGQPTQFDPAAAARRLAEIRP